MPGQPKPTFYVIVGVVVVALVAFAVYRLSPKPDPTAKSTAPDIKLPSQAGGDPNAKKPEVDKLDPGELTEKAYEIVPEQTLIKATGQAGYKKLAETGGVVNFAINVWAGWGPIILANEGFKAGKVWKTPDGQEFKVEITLIDDVEAMRAAYTTGQVHIGWGTLDMLPLFLQTLCREDGTPIDTRTMPRVYQQIDWSEGGDGIAWRPSISKVAELKGKKIALAQFSPSHYFALNMLVNGGVQPKDVQFVFTKSAFQAAAAFNDRPDLSACVSWSPDIYKLAKSGNKLLVTTAQANKLIADVWYARADFARDYPGIIESLVRGIFDAMDEINTDDKDKAEKVKRRVAELMAAGYNLPADATYDMQGDAHITNWAENYQFFVNQNNPTNFERVWNNAYFLYSHPQIKAITHKQVPFDKVMDYTFIKKLGAEAKYANQKDKSKKTFVPAPLPEGTEEFLGNRYHIRFFPNSFDLHKKINRANKEGKDEEVLYDLHVDEIIDKIAQLVGTFGAARIVIEGHTDSSMKTQVPAEDRESLAVEVKKLSEQRATAVKQALVEKYKLDPNQFSVRGMGWEKPADASDPNNHTLNRRVEVKVYPPEAK